MKDNDTRALVGYERRLRKMKRLELLAEAERVGAPVMGTEREFMLLSALITRILAAQGIYPDILKDPPS